MFLLHKFNIYILYHNQKYEISANSIVSHIRKQFINFRVASLHCVAYSVLHFAILHYSVLQNCNITCIIILLDFPSQHTNAYFQGMCNIVYFKYKVFKILPLKMILVIVSGYFQSILTNFKDNLNAKTITGKLSS